LFKYYIIDEQRPFILYATDGEQITSPHTVLNGEEEGSLGNQPPAVRMTSKTMYDMIGVIYGGRE